MLPINTTSFGKPNFQSGFGNANNFADSIGSIFGLGPENRDSVLARKEQELQPFISEVQSIYNTQGLSSAKTHIDNYIAELKALLKKRKSANSKAGINHKISILGKLKSSLNSNVSKSKQNVFKPTKSDNDIVRANNVHTQQSNNNQNIMYMAIGVIALLFSKKLFK